MLDWLKGLESYWWIVIVVSVVTLLRVFYDEARRKRLSEEKRAEEDHAKARAKLESKELWGELYSILWLVAICAVGLWVIGHFTGIGEPRAFMASALALLWLIFRRLDKTWNALALKRLIEISGHLDRIGNILGGILASMREPSREVEPRSDWASLKKPGQK